jgi:hypothetical protein
MNFLKIVVASAVLCFALASNMGASHAQETQRLLVVPVDGEGPELSNTAKQLTKALADAAGKTGASVETGSVTRFEVTELVGCGDEAPDAAALEAQIVDIANKSFGRTAAAVVPPPPVVDPVPTPTPTPMPTPSSSSSFSLSKVDTTRWVITGTGAALAVVGGIVLAVASGKQSGLDDAPNSTREEIDRLLDKEKTAERYQLIGNSVLIAGGVTFAVGATLAILQARRSESSETPAMVIAPSPIQGGAMINLTLFQ